MIKTPLRGRKDPLKFASLPTCGFVAQLVERPTSIREAWVQAPSKPEFFSGFNFCNCFNCSLPLKISSLLITRRSDNIYSYIISDYEIYRSSTLVHYDPTREDHKQFEQIAEKETEKPDARPTLAQEKQSEETALPEVSQDKYYEANTSVLANFFGSKKEVR